MNRIIIFYYKKFLTSFSVVFSSLFMVLLMSLMIIFTKIILVSKVNDDYINNGYNSLNATINFFYLLPILGILIFVVTFLPKIYFSKNENSNIDSQILSIVNNRNKFVFGKIIAVITFSIVWSIVAGMFMFFITFIDSLPSLSLRFNYSLGFTLALIILTLIIIFTFMALKILISSVFSVLILMSAFLALAIPYLVFNTVNGYAYQYSMGQRAIVSPVKTRAIPISGPVKGVPTSGQQRSAWNYLNNFDPISGFVNIASSKYVPFPLLSSHVFYEENVLEYNNNYFSQADFVSKDRLENAYQAMSDNYANVTGLMESLGEMSVYGKNALLELFKHFKKYTSTIDEQNIYIKDLYWVKDMDQLIIDSNLHLTVDQLPMHHFPRNLDELSKEANKDFYNFPAAEKYLDDNIFHPIYNYLLEDKKITYINTFRKLNSDFFPTEKLFLETLGQENYNYILSELKRVDDSAKDLFGKNAAKTISNNYMYPIRTGSNWLIIWFVYFSILMTVVIIIELKKDFR